jgi:hypothetical protein
MATTQTWTISKRLSAGDRFEVMSHECRVTEILEHKHDYNEALVEVVRPIPQKDRDGIEHLPPPLKFGRLPE